MPEPKQHAEQRNWLERLGRAIPGFRGYLEKEYRRDSDRLQRTWLADRIARSKKGLDELSRTMVDRGQVDVLPQLDRLRGRIDKLLGRIRGAMAGGSGVFDLVRIDEAVLDRIYAHDLSLMDEATALGEALDKLPTQADAPTAALPAITALVDAFEAQWNEREDILRGLD